MDLPEYMRPLEPEETFTFRCRPGLACFTECCRSLDLALGPYDCLRLRQALDTDSATLLERYVIVEKAEEDPFPRCFLTMVDDGRASCVFVRRDGCAVYAHRPAACRCYPLGRGVSVTADGGVREHFVMVREPHCQGFAEPREENARSYMEDQELAPYQEFDDRHAALWQHPRLQAGLRPGMDLLHRYMLCLYNLDEFRKALAAGAMGLPWPADLRQTRALAGDDEALLDLGLDLMRHALDTAP